MNAQYTIGINADTSKAQSAINSLKQSLQAVQAQRYNISIDDGRIVEAAQAAQVLQNELIKATNINTGKLDLTKLNTSLAQAKTSVGELGKTLLAAGDQGQAAFSQLVNTISTAQAPIKTLSKTFTTISTTLMNTIKWQAASSLIHGAMSSISGAISYAKNLNSTLTDIRVVTGASSDEMARFAIQANNAAKALSSSTNDFAKASLIYYQQGNDAATAAKKAEITTKAANVAFTASAKEMSEMLTAVWNSYQVGNDQLEHTVDIMAKLGAATASSMEEMATGMQKVAATANTVGVSMEQMSAMIATSASVTRQAPEQIGTAWNTILSRIGGLKLGETLEDGVDLNKYSKALETIGVKVLDATGELRSMGLVVDEIGAKWDTLTTAQKSALAQTVGGTRQYTQIMAFFENFDKYQANLTTAKNSNGALQQQQEIWAEGWEAASQRSRAAMEDLYNQLIDEKALIKLTDLFTTLTNGITSITKSFGGALNVISLVATTIVSSHIDTFSTRLMEIGNNIKTLFSGNQEIDQYASTIANLQAELKSLSADESISDATRIELEYNIEILDIKKQLAESQGRLTKEQVNTANATIQQLEATRDLYTNLARMREEAEKTANTNKENIKNQFAEKLGREAYIEEQMNKKSDPLTRREAEIAYLSLNAETRNYYKPTEASPLTIGDDLKKELSQFDQELELTQLKLNGLTVDNVIDGIGTATVKAKELKNVAAQIQEAFSFTDKNGQVQTGYNYYQGTPEQRDAFLQKVANYGKNSNDANLQEAGTNIENGMAAIQNGDTTGVDKINRALELFNQTLSDSAERINQFRDKLKTTLGDKIDSKALDNLIRDFEKIAPNLNNVTDDAKKAVEQMKASISKSLSAASANVQLFVSTVMTIQRVLTLISSVKNMWETLTNPDASGLEKIAAIVGTLVTLGFTVNSLMSLLKTNKMQNILADAKIIASSMGVTAAKTTEGFAWLFTAKGVQAFWEALGPIGWIILAITALVSLVTALASAIGKAEENEKKAAQERTNLVNSYNEINAQIDEQKTKLAQLSDIIHDNTLTMTEQLSKINEITAAFGYEATAIDVLNGSYTNLANNIKTVAADQIHKRIGTAQENIEKWRGQLDDALDEYITTTTDSENNETITTYDDYFTTANRNAGARSSLFNSNAWSAGNWSKDNNVSGIVRKGYTEDEYLSNEGLAWAELAPQLEKLGFIYDRESATLTAADGGAGYTAEGIQALYEFLQNTDVFEEHSANVGEGSYYSAIMADLEDNLYASRLNNAIKQEQSLELLSSLFSIQGGNFDLANVSGEEITVNDIKSLIDDTIADNHENTAQNRQYILDYISSFGEYSDAALQYQGVEDLTRVAANLNWNAENAVNFGIANKEELQSKIINDLFGELDDEFTIEALLAIRPTDIILDETGQHFTIDEQTKKLVTARAKTASAQSRQETLKEQEKLFTQKTYTKEDAHKLFDTGLFESIEDVQAFMSKGLAERTSLFNEMQAAAIDEEIAGLNEQIELANDGIEEFKANEDELNNKLIEAKDNLIRNSVLTEDDIKAAENEDGSFNHEFLYELINNKRTELKRLRDEQQALIDEYNSTDWTEDGADKEGFAKKVGAKSWDDVDEQIGEAYGVVAGLDYQLDLMDSELAYYDSQWQKYLALQDEVTTATADLDVAEWWRDVGQYIQLANNGIEKFTDAMSNYHHVSAEDLAELQRLYEHLYPDSETDVFDIYKTSSESEWRKFALDNALAYYDELARYSEDSEATLIEIEQEKKNVIAEYYDWLNEQLEQSAEAFDSYIDSIQNKIELLNDAIDSMGKLSEGTTFGELSAQEINKIKQALLEVGYTAEEVNQVLLNLGKDQNLTDEETIWATAKEKTALLLKELSLSEQGQDQIATAQTAIIQVAEGDAELTTVVYDAATGAYKAPTKDSIANVDVTETESGFEEKTYLQCIDGAWQIVTENTDGTVTFNVLEGAKLPPDSTIRYNAERGFYVETKNLKGETITFDLKDETGNWNPDNSVLKYNEQTGGFYVEVSDGKETYTWTLDVVDLTNKLGEEGVESALRKNADGTWELNVNDNGVEWTMSVDDQLLTQWLDSNGVITPAEGGGFEFKVANTDITIYFEADPNIDTANLPTGLAWTPGVGFSVDQNGIIIPISFGAEGLDLKELQVDSEGRVWLKDAEGTSTTSISGETNYGKINDDESIDLFDSATDEQIGTITQEDAKYVISASGTPIYDPKTGIATTNTTNGPQVNTGTTMRFNPHVTIQQLQSVNPDNKSAADILAEVFPKRNGFSEFWLGRNAATPAEIGSDFIINPGRLNDFIELIQALDLDAPENMDVLNLLNASGFIIGSGSSYQQSGIYGMHLNNSRTIGRSADTLLTLLSNTLPDLDTTGLLDWINASDNDLYADQGLQGVLNWLQELDTALEGNSDKDFWKQQIGSMFAGMGYETLIEELAVGANEAAAKASWDGANETEVATEYFNSFIQGLNQLFDLSGLDEDLQTNLAQELQNILTTIAGAEDPDELIDTLLINGIDSEIFSTLINITDSEGNRIGEYLAEGLLMGFMNNVSAEGYAGAAEGILTILCSVFGIASPSKRTIEMGQYLAQGLGIGLNNVDLSKDASAFAKSFISTLSSALQEEAKNTGVSAEELMYQYLTNGSNTGYSLYGHGYNFKLNDNNKWVISHNGEIQDGEYESLKQAQNTALATEYVSSKILNEYLQNANSDIEGRTAFQNHVVSKMVNTAIEKFIEEHPEVVDQADSAGQSVLEYVTSHWDDLSGDFVPYFEDAYNNLGKLLETDADEASAKFKDIWKEALVAVVKLEEDEAQRVAEIWESTFEAIGKARLAAIKGDSLASTLSDAELKDMARLYLKTNPNASYSELQDFLLHPQKESDVPNFETYNAPESRSGIAKYLADSSGTSVYGKNQNGQGAYFANQVATYSADATYDAMANDYAQIIQENLSDTDWMQTIADQFGLTLEDMAALDETFMMSHGYTQDEEGNIHDSSGQLISADAFMEQYSREIADMVMETQYGAKGSDKWENAVQESYIDQVTADTIYLQSLIDQENSELTTLNSKLDDLYTVASKMADGTATPEEEATYYKHFDSAENPYSAMLSIGQQKDQNTYQTAINTALIDSGVVQNENGDWMYNGQNLGTNNQSAFIQRALMGVNGGEATFNEDTQQYEAEINGKTEQLGSTIDEVITTLQQLIDAGTITDESGFIQGLTPDKIPTLYDYNEEEAYNANVVSLSKEAGTDIDTITYDSLQLLDQQAIVLEENQHAWEDLTYAQKQSLAEIAAQNYKLQSGMEELRDVTKDTWTTLKDASQKGTTEYKKAINSMKNIMSKVFNTDMDKILEYDADFVEEHLDEMEKMATGTEEEVRAAEEVIQDDLVATFIEAEAQINDALKEPLTVQIDADGPAAEFNNLTSFFQNAFDQWDDMAEVTIEADTGPAETSVIAAMQTILDSGLMTAAQINDALNMIGWEPEIEYQDYVATQQDVDRGWAEVLDINGNIHRVSLSSEAEVGSTVQVPIIKSAHKGPGAAAAPKSGKKGGGGGGGGGGSKKQTHDKIKPDKRYQTVDRQLDDQSKLLEKISQEKEKAYGPRYLKYLNEEIKALEKENELYEEKLRQNEQWLSHDLNDLETQTKRLANTLGVNMQLTFDENGEVSNLQEMWEAFQKKYNEFADKEMSDDDFKKYEDAWKEWEESFGQYQETLDTRDDIVQEMQDNLDQISENILEGIKVKAEYRIELNDADIKLLEYYQDKYEDILDKQGELTHSLLMQTGEYLDNAAITAQAIQELNEAFAAGNINEAQYQEEIAAQNENLLDTLKELNEMQDKINEAYEDAISLAEESFENQTDNLDHINTLLADYQSIVGLLGKGVDYGYNDKIYQAQIDNNLRMIEANKAMYDEMQKRVDEFEAKREAQGGVLDEADQEHYEAALERAHEYQEEILSEAQDTAQKIQDAYTNMIDNISNKLQESLLGDGESFQHLSDQYATYTEDMGDYLTAAKELSEISKLNREIDKSIEDSTTRASKERLLALQNEISAKAASNKLTDYDVQMLNLQYQLALKMAALEDAEDAKSVVRLTRDNNGNYAYQYTADEDKVASAQQEYEDVLQQINELAGNRITELEQSFIDAQTEYLDAATQIAQDTALTDEQRAERLEELWRNFQNDMLYLEEQYNNATGQMMQNQDAISAHYGQTLEDRAGQTIAGINDRVQSLIDNVDGFKDAWQEMLTGTGEDDNSILNAAADMGDAIKSLADYAKLTLSDEDIENFKEQAAAAVGAAVDLVGQLGDELDEVDAVTDAWNSQADALDRTINYYELLASSANKALHAVSELDDIATIPSLKDWTFVSTDNGLWPAGGISATDSSLALNQWQTLKTLEEINSDTTLTDEEKQTRLEELEQSYLETQTQLEQNVMIQELNSSFALYADAILGQMQMNAAIIAGGFMGISEILKNKDLSGDAINERAGEFSSLVINADFPNAHDANDIMNAFTQIEAMASQTKNSRIATASSGGGKSK